MIIEADTQWLTMVEGNQFHCLSIVANILQLDRNKRNTPL